AELGFLSEAVTEHGPEEPAYDPEILAAALKQIDAMEARDEGEIIVGEIPGRFGALLQGLVERLQWSMTPPLARIAIGAQFALVLGLVVALNSGQAPEGAYDVVATEQPGDYILGFAPGVTEEQIRTLLLESNTTIIDGPSSSGFYVIDIDDSVDEAAAVARIRASGLSAFLQPVPQPSLDTGPAP
ncbi:MAG: hypothetical protein O7E57_14810, partial [Gammaproteobacteria bacterium]|nr:hypothetical protein [Gammaproteobacteria bacterium]